MAKARHTYTFEERKQVVRAVQEGASPNEVSQLLKIPARCVFRWLSWYRQGGWDALKTGPRSGAPRKVSDHVMAWIYETITQGNPRQHQLDFGLWTLNLIRTLLKKTYGIVLSKSSVSRLLAQLGLSPQRPIYRSYKRNPEKMQQYLSKTFPELKAEAKRLGAEIYFVDECAVRSDSHRGTTWGVAGETPVVEDSGGRFGLRIVSAVSPRGDLRFEVFEGAMNSERFIQFLKRLRHDAGKPIIVICDNARYHVSKKTRQFVAESEDIIMENLPAYCPELNPDEQVWNHMKNRLRQRFVDSKQEMRRQCINILRSIQKLPKLVKSFFQLRDTSYASQTG